MSLHPRLNRSARAAAALTTVAALAGLGSLAGSAGASAAPAPEAGEATLAPLVDAGEDAIARDYIVFLDQSAKPGQEAREAVAGPGGTVNEVYTSLGGYAATLTASQLTEVRSDPAVAFVQEDSMMSIEATQNNPTWGLDRIDQRSGLSGSYTYNRTGAGVDVYVIDTGLNATHSEFAGRVAPGATAISDGRGTTDCNGHGTHVAGTSVGSTYGVAKAATIIPIRVLGCDGSGANSGVVAGMDYVASNASGPSVANMSLGGGADTATDAAIARMTSAGVTTVVAAGNENQNACNTSPARASSAITVAASDRNDARASFSNFGSCVDIFAPGVNITSAWIGGNSATNTISGTSMASPHVAGVAALYLQGNPGASPATVTSALVNNSTSNAVSGVNGSPNRLLFTNY